RQKHPLENLRLGGRGDRQARTDQEHTHKRARERRSATRTHEALLLLFVLFVGRTEQGHSTLLNERAQRNITLWGISHVLSYRSGRNSVPTTPLQPDNARRRDIASVTFTP